MGSDSLVVEYAPSVSGGETPVDFKFEAIHPAVPGTGALAEFRERRHPLAPQALPRPQAGFQFGRIKPATVLGGCGVPRIASTAGVLLAHLSWW